MRIHASHLMEIENSSQNTGTFVSLSLHDIPWHRCSRYYSVCSIFPQLISSVFLGFFQEQWWDKQGFIWGLWGRGAFQGGGKKPRPEELPPAQTPGFRLGPLHRRAAEALRTLRGPGWGCCVLTPLPQEQASWSASIPLPGSSNLSLLLQHRRPQLPGKGPLKQPRLP